MKTKMEFFASNSMKLLKPLHAFTYRKIWVNASRPKKLRRCSRNGNHLWGHPLSAVSIPVRMWPRSLFWNQGWDGGRKWQQMRKAKWNTRTWLISFQRTKWIRKKTGNQIEDHHAEVSSMIDPDHSLCYLSYPTGYYLQSFIRSLTNASRSLSCCLLCTTASFMPLSISMLLATNLLMQMLREKLTI